MLEIKSKDIVYCTLQVQTALLVSKAGLKDDEY